MPNLSHSLQTIPEAELLRQMVQMYQAGDRRGLLQLQKRFGIHDCKCKVTFLPCLRHKTWRAWAKVKAPAWLIAAQWTWATKEPVAVKEVESYLAQGRADCDCPARFKPCRHQGGKNDLAGLQVPFSVHILLRYLLWPERYQEPPLDSFPSMVLLKSKKVWDMRRRAADGLQIYHPGDLLQRDLVIDAIDRFITNSRSGANEPGQVVTDE